jgi:hypothetical protein
MAVEDSDKEDTEEENEEAQVDYREEFLTTIEVIRRENRKNKKLQAKLDVETELKFCFFNKFWYLRVFAFFRSNEFEIHLRLILGRE